MLLHHVQMHMLALYMIFFTHV
ncbi:Protein of unknown function [Gryllus bimaculatus]|nr:Protein of unknown function [Gryllus bimaculatus]